MRWFTNKKKQLEMIQALRPTSKATLKMQCLIICKADIDEANKLYEYFANDMPELPDYDPVAPTVLDNTKNIANGIVKWIGENKDTLVNAYEMIRSATGGKLPPLTLPMDTAEPAAFNALPEINS